MTETDLEKELERVKKELADYKAYVDRNVGKMLEVANRAAEWRFDSFCVAERDDDSLGALCLGLNMMVADTSEALAENKKALDELALVLESIPDPLFTVDGEMNVTNMNHAAAELFGVKEREAMGRPCREVFHSDHCDGEDCAIKKSLAQGKAVRGQDVIIETVDGRRIESLVNAAAIVDSKGKMVGGVEVVRDVTDERDRERALQEQVALIQQQKVAIQELSTPVLQLWDDVLALPVIGMVDSRRTAAMMEKLLNEIVARQSKFVILDITGVEVVDTTTADNFIKVMRAAELLGARCILTGIRPAVAQTVVDLGMDLTSIKTLRNLQAGLKECLRQMAQEKRSNSSKSPAKKEQSQR